jgi:hypothetical protein
MTNAERILAEIRAHPGLTDAELRVRTGIEPHQQVNQICRRLAARGLIRREARQIGPIVNVPVAEPVTRWRTRPAGAAQARGFGGRPAEAMRPATARTTGRLHPGQREDTPPTPWDLPAPNSTLIVIPCSGSKRPGGVATTASTVIDLLPTDLADKLVAARARVAAHAGLDESRLLPAWQRYDGQLYRSARALGEPSRRGLAVAIVSGGYGVLLADDRIGDYNRRFSPGDWPPGLLEACLVSIAARLGKHTVIAFCSRTTGYADLVRRVPWRDAGLGAYLASPDTNGRRGTQVIVPRSEGEAVAAFADRTLTPGWTSSDGLALDWVRLG